MHEQVLRAWLRVKLVTQSIIEYTRRLHDVLMKSPDTSTFLDLFIDFRHLQWMSILGKCALLAAGVLLLTSQFVPPEVHAYVSSVPLALAGIGYALLQIQLRPRRAILLKRLVLAGAFLLWAVVQLLPSGPLAVFLSDTVIAAYVLDLFWVMRDQGQRDDRLPRVHEESLHE